MMVLAEDGVVLAKTLGIKGRQPEKPEDAGMNTRQEVALRTRRRADPDMYASGEFRYVAISFLF